MNQLEASLEHAAAKLATTHGCLLIKLQHSIVGLPDRLLVRPDTHDVYVEFKRTGERPTKIQAYWIERLQGMGKQVVVVRNLKTFRKLL